MRPSRLRSSDGFTYMAVLVMVMIVGFLAAQGALVWKTRMQREKETELIFRGTQIRDAMRLYYGMATEVTVQNTAATGAPANTTTKPQTIPPNAPMLNELKDLLQSPGSLQKKRFLRKLYLDPMTGKDFAMIKDPASNRVIGVTSTSEAEPIKKARFPFDLEPGDFEDKKKYNEWQFICNHYPKPDSTPGGKVTGLPTSGTSPRPGNQVPPPPAP